MSLFVAPAACATFPQISGLVVFILFCQGLPSCSVHTLVWYISSLLPSIAVLLSFPPHNTHCMSASTIPVSDCRTRSSQAILWGEQEKLVLCIRISSGKGDGDAHTQTVSASESLFTGTHSHYGHGYAQKALFSGIHISLHMCTQPPYAYAVVCFVFSLARLPFSSHHHFLFPTLDLDDIVLSMLALTHKGCSFISPTDGFVYLLLWYCSERTTQTFLFAAFK